MIEGPLPTGISSSIATLLPEPIYIPAVKNFGDDLKTSQSTTFGRLLGLLLDDLGSDLAQIQQSLATLNALLIRVDLGGELTDQRHERVRGLESRIEGFLKDNFPTVKLELNVPPPELKTILNTAQIFVDDGSRDLIENKGDGIKRSLTFALLQTYVHQREQAASTQQPLEAPRRPLLFLFEEPELYLHPRSQRILFDTLAKISSENQVVVTTHSPLFFAPGVTANFVRVAKVPAELKPKGRLHPVILSLETDSAEVFRLARFENADAAFFSRRVVLFEGESDDAYCKHVAKLLNPDWCFDKHCISMVRVSGKGNFGKFRRFFEAFGIEVKLVADLDALFDGYQHLVPPDELTELRAQTIAQIDARIQELGIRAEPATRQIRDKVHSASWRERYTQAKDALRQVQATNHVGADTVSLLDGLFTWEQEIARVKACREDDVARSLLTPLLDGLRASGICVLSRGAIEDYYPAGAENGQKPQRALTAIGLLADRAGLGGVSRPLAEGRDCELTEVFTELFRQHMEI
jgi:putative ATP-dependent endonuclease of the OLD family